MYSFFQVYDLIGYLSNLFQSIFGQKVLYLCHHLQDLLFQINLCIQVMTSRLQPLQGNNELIFLQLIFILVVLLKLWKVRTPNCHPTLFYSCINLSFNYLILFHIHLLYIFLVHLEH